MNFVAAPILLPLLVAIVCLALNQQPRLQRIIAGIGVHMVALVGVVVLWIASGGGLHLLHMGGWTGGYGIVLVLDRLAGIMVALSGLLLVVNFWFATATTTDRQERRYLHPLILFLVGGVNWAFLTGDLFNLFVSFEIILLSSYGILVHEADGGTIRESWRFVILNVFGGMMFLGAAGLIYGTFGALNFADLAVRLEATPQKPLAAVFAIVLLIVLGTKAAVFPFFFWLPNAYPRVSLPNLAFFTGMLTKVGVYTLYRVFSLPFGEIARIYLQDFLLVVAGLTMIVGVFAALGQWTMRRILSIHIISQIGYMIFGLAMLTPEGAAGGLFAVVHNILVKTSLFLAAGCVVVAYGTDSLERVRGALVDRPALAVLFLLAALSLAGIPPLSGFYPKWALVREGLAQGHNGVVFVSILTSLFTLASMVKIWTHVFLGEPRPEVPASAETPGSRRALAVTTGLTLATVVLAIASGPVYHYLEAASIQLFDTRAYTGAVESSAFSVLPSMGGVEP